MKKYNLKEEIVVPNYPDAMDIFEAEDINNNSISTVIDKISHSCIGLAI